QIDKVVFSTDLERDEPLFTGGETSGYHGLYNVRRMSPEGMWRACWRKPDEDLGLTMTMPAGIAQQVIVCDASPELQPGNPDEIQYVLGRRVLPDAAMDEGETLTSTFVAAVEPHRGAPKIARVELLEGTSPNAETTGVAVYREGAVDIIHSALAPERCEWRFGDQTLAVDAEWAMVTLADGAVARAMIVNGTSLRMGDFTLDGRPALEATVTDVDLNADTITIDATVPDPQALVGRVVILGNELQSASYTVTEAAAVDAGVRLGFGDVLLIFGMGAVAATDGAAGIVTSDRDLADYGRIDRGHHAGRWLYNESRTEGRRIASVNGRVFTLDDAPADLDTFFTDDDGDGRRLYWISDVRPGDVCRIPAAAWFQR
ncbi:MAG: hypothetical protein J7M38_15185, partial [Armatimonadetes bacterium]|nr:hypothetical protein [Armatimonadota bacterium]